MVEALALIGKDVAAVAATLMVIALVSIEITRRSARLSFALPSLPAISVNLPTIDFSPLGELLDDWRRRLNSVRAPNTPTVAFPAPSNEPLTIEVQWARLSGTIVSRIEAMQRTGGLQQRASSQIDAAGYALERLFDELADVMTITRTPIEPALRLVEAVPTRRQSAAQLAA